jgi:hypothetical protein
MAAGASVTWTHCSILSEVTWGKTMRVCADTTMRPRGHRPVHADELTSLTSPSLPSPLPCGRSLLSAWMREFYFILFYFLVVVAGLDRDTIYNLQFTIYNLQFIIYNFRFSVFNPQDPQTPRAPRASWAKPREEEGFFGLVPLVTHPSSIPLLGGLIPKFLSLSFHSL